MVIEQHDRTLNQVITAIRFPTGLSGKMLMKNDILKDGDLVYVGDFTKIHSWKKVFQTGVILNEHQSGLFFRPHQEYNVDSVGYYVSAKSKSALIKPKLQIEVKCPDFNTRPLNLKGRFLRKGERVKEGDLVDFGAYLDSEPSKWKRVIKHGQEADFDDWWFRPSEAYRVDAYGYYVGVCSSNSETIIDAEVVSNEPKKQEHKIKFPNEFLLKEDYS